MTSSFRLDGQVGCPLLRPESKIGVYVQGDLLHDGVGRCCALRALPAPPGAPRPIDLVVDRLALLLTEETCRRGR
jgi:hypothetical protein